MKALIIRDEINQFHWAMLKSVLLILTLLPISQGIATLYNATEGSSQIMLGFFALSLFSALLILCFCSALKITVLTLKLQQISALEQQLLTIYRRIPMLFLASLTSYLAAQL